MELKRKETIGWIDLLRVIACFLVVFAHCCDPFVARFDTDRSTFLQGCAAGSAVRSCVPLFVMMTGVLLFPLRSSMNEFYRKRIGRIVPPLIFWSVMLPVLYFVYLNYIATTDNPTIDMSTFTWQMTVTKICTFIFNFNYDTHAPLVSLYADRAVFRYTRFRGMARPSLTKRCQAVPSYLGNLLISSLSENGSSRIGIHR